MTSKTEQTGAQSRTPTRDKPPTPVFGPARESDRLPAFEVQAPAAIGREAEPEIAQGVDLSGRAKIVMAAGRGKTGKTTLLRWMAEQSLEAGRTFLMADIDPTNASFAAYFEGVSRPRDDDPLRVRDWLQRFIEYAVSNELSALIDLGGGDTTLRSIAAEMPGFDAMIEEAGLAVAIFYLVGPHPEDLTPIATLSGARLQSAAACDRTERGHGADRAVQRLPHVVVDRAAGAVSTKCGKLISSPARRERDRPMDLQRTVFSALQRGGTSH